MSTREVAADLNRNNLGESRDKNLMKWIQGNERMKVETARIGNYFPGRDYHLEKKSLLVGSLVDQQKMQDSES